MKVGDLVRQSNGLVKFMKNGKEVPKPKSVGVVVAINDGSWPKDWDVEVANMWEMKVGRRIDVLWPSGKLTKSFAENSLEVVNDANQFIKTKIKG